MNPNYIFKIFFITFSICFIVGCAPKYNGSLYENLDNREKIEFSDYSLKIIDSRTDTTDKKIGITIFSHRGQKDRVSPKNNGELEMAFDEIIKEHQSFGGQKLDFELEILQAYQEFSATAFSEREAVFWSIVINVNRTVRNTHGLKGKCTGEKSSIDASIKNINAMYIKCFKNAVTNAMQGYRQ